MVTSDSAVNFHHAVNFKDFPRACRRTAQCRLLVIRSFRASSFTSANFFSFFSGPSRSAPIPVDALLIIRSPYEGTFIVADVFFVYFIGGSWNVTADEAPTMMRRHQRPRWSAALPLATRKMSNEMYIDEMTKWRSSRHDEMTKWRSSRHDEMTKWRLSRHDGMTKWRSSRHDGMTKWRSSRHDEMAKWRSSRHDDMTMKPPLLGNSAF